MDLLTLVRIVLRRWYLVAPTLLLTAVSVFLLDQRIAPTFEARATLLLLGPSQQEKPINPYLNFGGSLEATAIVTKEVITSSDVALKLQEAGADAPYAVEVASGTPILTVKAEGTKREASVRTVQLVIQEIQHQLESRQRLAGAPANSLIRPEVLSRHEPVALWRGKRRVLVTAMALGVASSGGLALIAEGIAYWRRLRRVTSPEHDAIPAGDERRMVEPVISRPRGQASTAASSERSAPFTPRVNGLVITRQGSAD